MSGDISAALSEKINGSNYISQQPRAALLIGIQQAEDLGNSIKCNLTKQLIIIVVLVVSGGGLSYKKK